jgi:hypothetical protein
MNEETKLNEKETETSAIETDTTGDENSLSTVTSSDKPAWPPNQDALERHRFKPGQSGNPGGKPKIKKYRDAATKIGDLDAEQLENYKPKTVLEAATVAMFKAIMNPSRNSAAAVSAYNSLSDRVDGKPKPSDEELKSSKNHIVVVGTDLIHKQQDHDE